MITRTTIETGPYLGGAVAAKAPKLAEGLHIPTGRPFWGLHDAKKGSTTVYWIGVAPE